MTRISKDTREQAALICAVAASGGVHEGLWRSFDYLRICEYLEFPMAALHLSIKAWKLSTNARNGGIWTREGDAEAEAMLRTGWSP
jgi:hypothetical protein